MIYTIELEMHSDLGDSISDAPNKALQPTFGKIDKLRIVPVRTYIGYIQRDQPIIWTEVLHDQ
jgi:hypothetical protein